MIKTNYTFLLTLNLKYYDGTSNNSTVISYAVLLVLLIERSRCFLFINLLFVPPLISMPSTKVCVYFECGCVNIV